MPFLRNSFDYCEFKAINMTFLTELKTLDLLYFIPSTDFVFHTNLRAAPSRRILNTKSNAIGANSPDIFRVFQKCSTSRRRHYKKIRARPHRRKTSGSLSQATIYITDSECAENHFFLFRLF
jgi:hypothetical protein